VSTQSRPAHRLNRFGHGGAHVICLEFTFEQAEYSIGNYKTADARDVVFRIFCSREERARRAFDSRAKFLDHLAAKLDKARKMGLLLRYARAAEKDNIAIVSGDEKLVWNEWAIGYEAHG